MPIWRLQCAAQADTTFASDALIITPHFNDSTSATGPQGLCDDLADALVAYYPVARQIVVTAYDAQGTPPVFPQGTAQRNMGVAPTSGGVRETAVCLSYYSELNRPRQRGRLYIPTALAGITTGGARPSASNMQKVADLVPILTGLGGIDVDWVVYSRVDDVARPVTNWWVDNAWDTMRSRGLNASERLEGTVSE